MSNNKFSISTKIFNPKYLVLPFVLAGAIYGSNIASAAEDKPVNVIYSQDSLTLQINQEGDYYEVYKNGERIYKGENNNFTDSNNEDGQNYKVGIFKNDKLEDVVVVKTNKDESKSIENQSMMMVQEDTDILKQQVHNGYLEAVATPDKVSLEWSELIDNDGIYEIYRDEKKIAETKELEFTDTKVKGDQRYRYEVVAKAEVDSKTKEKIDKELKEKKIKVTKEQKEALYNADGIFTKIVDTPTRDDNSLKTKPSFFEEEASESLAKDTEVSMSATFPRSEEYSFSYMTFIPQKSIIDFYNPSYYLKGDNRSYDPYSSKYRTKSEVNVGFWMPYMTHYPDTGVSHRCYTSACTSPYKDTAQIGTEGIKISKDIVSTTKMRWRMNHDVGIPFGAAYPNITYYYDAVLTKSSLSVTGSHDKAPAHEFYMFAATTSNYITIERHWVDSTWDFTALIPGLVPQKYFNFSL